MFITWQTNASDWKYLFDPAKQDSVQHLPIGPLVEAPRLRKQVADNQLVADQQLIAIIQNATLTGLFDDAAVKQFLTSIPKPSRSEASAGANPALDASRQSILDTIAFLRKDLASLAD